MPVSKRYVTINGEKVHYTYDPRNCEVKIPGHPPFRAECWDSAPDQVREAIARVGATT